MFFPQWQTNTPMLGFSSETSLCSGLGGGAAFSLSTIEIIALAAEPLPMATLSGMSLGPWLHPARYTPSLVELMGSVRMDSDLKNPFSSTSMPSTLESCLLALEGMMAVESTRRSTVLSFSSLVWVSR